MSEVIDKRKAKIDQPSLKIDLTKHYEAPVLKCFGDIRDITLGGSQNPGDPGVPASTRRNF